LSALYSLQANGYGTTLLYIYCINPYKFFVNALSPSYLLHVTETLGDSEKCVFELKKIVTN